MSQQRLGSLITLLLPARSYKINCAWTTEKLMPGIEQFACRLLLVFDQLYPSELQNYFGLSDREREVLLDSLLANRLITIHPDGHVEASSFLRKHAVSNGGKPSLVKYQERTEEVAFDLLTLSVCKPQALLRRFSGLPELLPRDKVVADTTAVIEAFSSQYRHHLALSRNNEYERQRTQLYKVMGCSSHEMVLILVEIEVSYDTSTGGELQKFTRSHECIGNRRLPLANELEAHIADFLGEQKLEELGIDCESYCNAVKDLVLLQFANGYKFDYSRWLEARNQRKTGYGNPQTSGMLGAVYLPDNAKRFISALRDSLRDYGGGLTPKVMWYSSRVPLWGSNGRQLAEFNRDIGDILDKYHADGKSPGVTLLHQSDNDAEKLSQRKNHSGRFANGIALTANVKFDRLEMLLIPGVIGLVQYHGQPNADSALTLPVGYITTDPERLQLLERLLASRVMGALATINWNESKSETLGTLLSDGILANLDKKSGDDVEKAIRRIQKATRSDVARAILSLRN